MVRNLSARLQTLFVLVGMVVLFGIASPHFLTTDNLLNVMQQSAINAILGIGLTFVIISGGIDLSVGSILALCGLVTADLLVTGFIGAGGDPRRCGGRTGLRPHQRCGDHPRTDPAVHLHPGDDARRPQRGQRSTPTPNPSAVCPRAFARSPATSSESRYWSSWSACSM